MVILAAGLQFITVSNDWRDNFDKDNPHRVAFEALEDTYTATNVALIASGPQRGLEYFHP